MIKFIVRHLWIAVDAAYNWQRRYRELLSFEKDDIVLQVQYSEKGVGPWKVARDEKENFIVLRNPQGDEISVYRSYIRKVSGPNTKARW